MPAPLLNPPATTVIPILRYSTQDLPPEARHQAWLNRDWPRVKPTFLTQPTEPFNTVMDSAPIGQLLFVYTEITAMTWERRAEDIRESDFQPLVVNMMVQGSAQGEMDGRPFFEPEGSYHFQDLGRPSLHSSTASVTYSLILPRDLARARFGPLRDLHGLVVTGDMASALMDLAVTFWRLLPGLTPQGAARFEQAFLELLAAGAEVAARDQPAIARPEEALRAAAIEAVDQKLGLERATPSELCRVLNVQLDQLSVAFRVDGGVKAYLLARRLDEARTALGGIEKAEPIGNIAHRLGFSDAAHLSRTFRQRFGLSPRAWRALYGRGGGDR